jgi:L-serine/L-threonine ammonia-lyase
VSACTAFLADHRIVVEPACGAALAAVYDNDPALAEFETPLVIICGGVTATVEQLQQWMSDLSVQPNAASDH